MALDPSRHPCFNDQSRHQFGRIHLPVAPKCNIQCHFCNRSYDCAAENRPGVTSAVLAPHQALYYLERALKRDPRISVVGIAGPGDPLANAAETLETLRLVRGRYPEMLLCVASNGLAVPPHVDALAELDVSHVTVTVNAVDAEIGGKIVGWVREGTRIQRGRAGAELLISRQLEAIRALAARKVLVKVNCIIIPGINDAHVAEVARTVKECGAEILNCIPMYPVAHTPFANLTPPTDELVASVRAAAAEFLPLMYHCTRCRADAVGLLGEDMPVELLGCLKEAAAQPLNPEQERPYVAVASREGVLVNEHLGEARTLEIFAREPDGFRRIESRPTPPSGGGAERWTALAESLHDCRAILVASAGGTPKATLAKHGIRLVMMEGLIEEGLNAVFQNLEIRAPLHRKHSCGSGSGCAGNGLGCM
jgi:nitrogen fixation protein NifB